MARLMVNRLALIERIEQRMAAEQDAFERDSAKYAKLLPDLLAWQAAQLERAVQRGDVSIRSAQYHSSPATSTAIIELGEVPKRLVPALVKPTEPNRASHERSLAVLRIASRDEISVNTDDFRSYL